MARLLTMNEAAASYAGLVLELRGYSGAMPARVTGYTVDIKGTEPIVQSITCVVANGVLDLYAYDMGRRWRAWSEEPDKVLLEVTPWA